MTVHNYCPKGHGSDWIHGHLNEGFGACRQCGHPENCAAPAGQCEKRHASARAEAQDRADAAYTVRRGL